MTEHFADVTELAGTEISAEQLERMSHRYHWAAGFCAGKDVVEVACGSGQGLGILAATSASLEAGDISSKILDIPRRHYGSRVKLTEFDAQALPFADRSKDVIILFEAIYYVPDAARFVAECRRVLRPGGAVLIATANKDLKDFNPSPYSNRYYGAAELSALFREHGFEVELFGHLPVATVSWRQKILRPVKQVAVALNLVPKTMAGKKLLKRLVFGRLVPMPEELPRSQSPIGALQRLAPGQPDSQHKVLYAHATLRG
jgi:ubiquinone/menaquinone biosynthesis C-methylase UbiE